MGGNDVRGVETLLTITHRQRHVQGGQAQGGQLRHRPRPGAAQHAVGAGVGLLHGGQVVQDVVARTQALRGPVIQGVLQGGPHRRVLAPAGEVEDLEALREAGQGGAHDLVEVLGAQGAARDQEGRGLGIQPQGGGPLEPGGALALGGGALGDQVGHGRTQRQAGHLGAAVGGAQGRGGEGQAHRGGPGGPQPVGQAGAGVLLVDDHRDTGLAGSQVGGGGDVATEPHHHVGPQTPDGLGRGGDRPVEAGGQAQQVHRGTPGHGDPGDQGQLQPGGGDEVGLQPLGGAQDQDLGVRVPAQGGVTQGVGGGQQGVDVPRRAATREQDAQWPGRGGR